jgi:2-polyprenyl-3-methyl-5-hydroxy-6-metoxy-1,4-benzoquinol methylase
MPAAGAERHVSAQPAPHDWTQTPPPAEIAQSEAPTITSEPVPACPVCGAGEGLFLAIGFDYELITCRNPWRFVRCRECGHAWLDPRPKSATLATIYPSSYYAYNYEHQINPIAVRGKHWLDRRKLKSILKALPRRPGSYLDVGCGDGRFLRVMESEGVPRAECHGLELDPRPVARLAAEGFSVWGERVEECARIPDGTLDLVTMFHVIEHVGDPGAVAASIYRWLAPGGVFALETPNLDSLDARLFKRTYWGGYHIPRHWHLFTPESVARMLRARGFEVVATRYQTGHSFWMYSMHHWLRYGPRPHPRLARWFDPFRGLPFLLMFTGWDTIRALLGFRTSAMLVLARKPART